MASPLPSEPPFKFKHRNHYFVDTNSNCFLCLQDVPSSQPLEVAVTPNEEAVEENTIKVDVDFKKRKQMARCSLRSIYKLIAVDPGKALSRTLIAGFRLNAQLHDTDLTVSLCEECLNITKYFASLCLELEIVQMKVNHALQGFLKVLQNSKNDPDKMAQFRSKITNPLDMLNVSLAVQMREETEKKCHTHLEKFPALPRVNLPDVKKNTTFKRRKTDQINSSNVQVIGATDRVTSACMNVDKPHPPLTPLTTKKVTIPGISCDLCTYTATSRRNLREHFKKRHPEALLPGQPGKTCPNLSVGAGSTSLPSVSNQAVNIPPIILKDYHLAEKQQKTNKTEPIFCQYCKRVFSRLRSKQLHQELSERCSKLAFERGNFVSVSCEYCRKVLPSSESLRIHKKYYCTQQFQPTNSAPEHQMSELDFFNGEEEMDETTTVSRIELSGSCSSRSTKVEVDELEITDAGIILPGDEERKLMTHSLEESDNIFLDTFQEDQLRIDNVYCIETEGEMNLITPDMEDPLSM